MGEESSNWLLLDKHHGLANVRAYTRYKNRDAQMGRGLVKEVAVVGVKRRGTVRERKDI